MPLTQHDAEEGTRQFEGRVIDAREEYAEVGNQANAEKLIARQVELIAALREQVRQAVSR